MRDAADAMVELARALHANGIVLLGSDRRLLSTGSLGGTAGSDARLADVAGSARQLFRQTNPPMHWLALEFSRGHVAIVSVGTSILLVRTDHALDPSTVMRALAPCRDSLEAFVARDVPAPPVSTIDCLDAVNLVSRELRRTLGGPVVRNYLRKAAADLAPRYAALASYRVDLEGQISADRDAAPASPAALGAWAHRVLERARTVVTDARDLRAITSEHAVALERAGFYEEIKS